MFQDCDFDVGSWAHPMDEIDIQASNDRYGDVNAADLNFFTKSSLFTLTQFSVEPFYYSDPELNNRTFSSKLELIEISISILYNKLDKLLTSTSSSH